MFENVFNGMFGKIAPANRCAYQANPQSASEKAHYTHSAPALTHNPTSKKSDYKPNPNTPTNTPAAYKWAQSPISSYFTNCILLYIFLPLLRFGIS